MATLKDISAELGLSVATVSRALNGFPEVNEQTRILVEETAKRLNYRPNRMAQKLQSGRSGMIGMIVRPDPKSPADRNFVEIMMGLSERLSAHDLDLVFQVCVDSDPVAPYRRMIESGTVDGFILDAPKVDDPRVAFLKRKKIPFAVHGRSVDSPDYPFFDIDNRQVTATAAELLYDLGHRRIALINGDRDASYAVARHKGFMTVAKERDMPVPEAYVIHDVPSFDYGYRAALSMLSGAAGDPPTAIICASTLIASGVYRAASDLGVSIPRDLSVIAHDDAVPELRAINFAPALTVTRAPLRDSCAPLTEVLIGALNGRDLDDLQKTETAELIVRQSTGPAPKEQ